MGLAACSNVFKFTLALFPVHNARQIVPPTAPGVPDTLCGVELIGPEHLSKKMVHSECALPGSFFEPTVYDYTIEWYFSIIIICDCWTIFDISVCCQGIICRAFGRITFVVFLCGNLLRIGWRHQVCLWRQRRRLWCVFQIPVYDVYLLWPLD
jgi:hypothetical protein